MKTLGIVTAVLALVLAAPANAQSPLFEYLFDEGSGTTTANSGNVSGFVGTLQDNATFSTVLPPLEELVRPWT